MHSYNHNIKTFNNATRHLTRVERSLYRDLIELYYDTEQPLDAVEIERLQRRVMAITQEEKDALDYVLSEFFVKTGSVYTHDYCDEQIDKYREVNTAKARAGKASAEARKKKAEERRLKRKEESEQNSTHDEHALSSRTQPRTKNHKPLTNNQDKEQGATEVTPTNAKKPRAKFVKPSITEVFEYFVERTEDVQRSKVEAQKFVDYFDSNGWKVGGKTKMVDWKAAVRNWITRSAERFGKPPDPDSPGAKRQAVRESIRNIKDTDW